MISQKTDGNVIKKRKQKLVKHKRKNWKKTDLTEIEKAIEDVKHEERTGGLRSAKTNEELFFIDKTKASIALQDNKIPSLKSNIKKSKKIELEWDKLKCYSALQPDPYGAPVHNTYSFTPRDPNSKRTSRYLEREAKKIESEVLKKQEKIVEKPLEQAEEERSSYDLWSDDRNLKIDNTNEYFLFTTKKIMPKKPKNFDLKTSLLPAIELPHPGSSYNPTYEDHQDLLLKAHMVELEKLRKEEKIVRNLDSKIIKMTHAQIEKLWLSEMSHGLDFEKVDGEEVDEANLVQNEETPIVKPQAAKVPWKLKKKQLEEKLKLRQKEIEKQKRIQENEIYRLKAIKKEVLQREEEIKSLKEKRDKLKKEYKHFKPHNLGHVKYEEPEIDVQLSEEISGNLRNLKVQGDILKDRYKSLQKRNMLEPRERAKKPKKKFWKKKFEKSTVKEITA